MRFSSPDRSAPLGAFVLLPLVFASSACIVLSAGDTDVQCTSDAECAGVGEGSTCDLGAQVCVVRSGGEGGSGSTTTSSVDTSTGAGGEDTGCTTNAECIDANGQQPYVCRSGDCVSLINANCTEFFGDVEQLKADDPLILGLLAPYVDSSDSYDGKLTRNAVRLVVEELDSAAQGLPIGANGARRPFVFLGCDELEDVEEGARFLVETVGVPAVYGPLDGDAALAVAANVTIPAGVLMMTPTGSSSLASIEDDGLLWITRYEGRGAGEAQAELLAVTEPVLREHYGLLEEEPLRLATIQRGDATGSEIFSGFAARATLNGEDVLTNIDDGSILAVPIPIDGSDFSTEIAAILDFEPHVIMTFTQTAGGSATAEAIVQVETSWPTAGAPYPVWMLDGAQKSNEVHLRVGGVTAEVEGVQRPMFATVPYLSPPDSAARDNYNAFSIRFRTRFFAEDGTTGGTGEAPQAYDAGYLLAYAAIAGAGGVPTLDGRAMAQGLQKLTSGAAVNIGPEYVQQAISPLKAGSTIQLIGVLKDYTFDERGNSEAIYASGCWAGELNAAIPTFSGFTYDPRDGEAAGTFGCPLDPIE